MITMRKRIADILENVLDGKAVDYATASELTNVKGADLWDLFAASGRIREHFRSNRVDLCSIVNAKSGECSENCAYCAQSIHHATDIPVYPLISLDQITEAAAIAKKNGAKKFAIVTSGRGIDSHDDLHNIANAIQQVRALGFFSCASLGTLTRDQLAFLKDAGLQRYHHNIETSREYFTRICTTHSFDERLQMLNQAQDIGLSICSGGILGMGEWMEDRIRMAFTLRDMDVDSVPINFLMPIAGTPLEHQVPIPPLEALHSIALFRFILPDKEIRICGGRGTAIRQLHPLIFAAGADGCMIGNYLTTSGLGPQEDITMIHQLGMTT